MKTKTAVISFTGAFMLLFSTVNISGNPRNILRSESEQTNKQTTQTKTAQTKTTGTASKSKQNPAKSNQQKPSTGKQGTTSVQNKKKNEPGTIKIGSQTWSVANLNVGTFRNGDTIPEAKTNKEWVAAGEAGKPAWCYYNNSAANGQKYGRLYNWYAVNDPRGLAPSGWSLAGDDDWSVLAHYLGGQQLAGIKMKSITGWSEGSNGTNESGFTGLPGGYRVENGLFMNLGSIAIWWGSSEYNNTSIVDHYVGLNSVLNRSNSPKQRGEAVRCIKK